MGAEGSSGPNGRGNRLWSEEGLRVRFSEAPRRKGRGQAGKRETQTYPPAGSESPKLK